MSNRTIKATLAIALIAFSGVVVASPAWANAGHYNISGPSLDDAGVVHPDASNGKRPCFTEPTGYHSQLHSDGACVAAQKAERMMHETVDSGTSKFVEPDGYHKQLRFNK